MRRASLEGLTEAEIAALRAEAARQGVSLETLLQRLIHDAADGTAARPAGGRGACVCRWSDSDAAEFTRAVACLEQLGGDETWN